MPLLGSLFKSYGRLFIFALGLLFGLQIPSFIDQYRQRVDAHFREVSINISGFQLTADAFFGGDLDALVTYYAESDDPVFTRDSNSLLIIVQRFRRIEAEQNRLMGGGLAVAWHVLVAPDEEFFAETLSQYSYTVPLNSQSLLWGASLALLLILLLDLGWIGCAKCVRVVRHRHAHRKPHME